MAGFLPSTNLIKVIE